MFNDIRLSFDPTDRLIHIETGQAGSVWHCEATGRFMAMLSPSLAAASWNNALWAATGDLPGHRVYFAGSQEQAREWVRARMAEGYRP